MGIVGLTWGGLILFVGYGFLVGLLFGFFGMGGSFLVTPALLVLGYPSTVAIGSGLAFVFGTATIAALKHRDTGQIAYSLGSAMILGMVLGVGVGKELVFRLDALGFADTVVGVAYVVLLGAVGLFVTCDSLRGKDRTKQTSIKFARRLQRYQLPPMLPVTEETSVSGWFVAGIGLVVGVISGLLGVGGGFLLLPVMLYAIGVPMTIAIATNAFQIAISSGVGTLLYAQSGAVNLPVVTMLLVGSGLGARIGSVASEIVDRARIKQYFGVLLLFGSMAITSKTVGHVFDIAVLNRVSIVLIFGATVLVSAAVGYTTLRTLRDGDATPAND